MSDNFREKVEQVLVDYATSDVYPLGKTEAYEKLCELFDIRYGGFVPPGPKMEFRRLGYTEKGCAYEYRRVWKNGCVYDPITGSYTIPSGKKYSSDGIRLASELDPDPLEVRCGI